MPILIFIGLLIGLIIRNFYLSKVLFYDWDEGMYAQIAHEIIKNKSLFTTFNQQVWLDKPPLVHSLISIVFLIFGRSEFWARMIMVIAAFIALILTYRLAQKLFKNQFIPSILSVLTLASSSIFLERSTLLNSDIFIAIAWLGYFLNWEKFWPKLFFLTLGVWSKSVLGFYPLVIELFNLFVTLLIHRKKIKINIKNILQSLILLIVPSLWYIVGLIKYKFFFIENHFLSQMLKRLYVPIELHFGNKFFYFEYLWNNLGLINFLFIISYILLTINFVITLRQKKQKIIETPIWFICLVLFSPIPFLALLTVMKTKITWYVVIFLPFLTLSISYLYLQIKNKIIQFSLVSIIIAYSIYQFTNQTFFSKVNYDSPPKIKVAQCISQSNLKKIAFLVDEEERKIKNFLEAAHYNTTSSFLYGGSPSFVYYSQKKIDYYYDVNQFINNKSQYQLIILSPKDLTGNLSLVQATKHLKKHICSNSQWLILSQ